MSLAVAEIRRAKLRFGLLVAAVGLLVFLILFQQALLGRLVTSFVGAVRNLDADIVVLGSGSEGNLEASRVPDGSLDAVAEIDGVSDVAEIAEATLTVDAGRELADATIWGYPLEGPGGPTTLTTGRMPRTDGEAVVSDGDEDAGFTSGAVVRVQPGNQPIRIVGVARDASFSGNPVLYLSTPTFEAARLAANPDAAAVVPSALAVRAAPGADLDRIARQIGTRVDGAEGFTLQAAEDATPAVGSVRASFAVILGLFYVVVPLVSGLFFLILTLQKANSLTVLRAIGAPRRMLITGLLGQVAAVVVAGVAVGTALLWGASQGTNRLGISVEAGPVLLTGSVVLALALIASAAAIRRVLAIDPILATTGAEVRA